jgi:hypothetical protein
MFLKSNVVRCQCVIAFPYRVLLEELKLDEWYNAKVVIIHRKIKERHIFAKGMIKERKDKKEEELEK